MAYHAMWIITTTTLATTHATSHTKTTTTQLLLQPSMESIVNSYTFSLLPPAWLIAFLWVSFSASYRQNIAFTSFHLHDFFHPRCYLHVTYILPTFYLHVTYMLPTCYLHVTYMLPTLLFHCVLKIWANPGHFLILIIFVVFSFQFQQYK